MEVQNFGSLEWRRRARQLWPTTSNRRKWLRAVHRLLTETKTGWVLHGKVPKKQPAKSQLMPSMQRLLNKYN